MEKENKELLLKDLCARLPYGVKVWYKYETWHCEMFATSIRLTDGKIALSSKLNKEGDWYPIEEAGEILIKSYLRPMSSMTEDERKYIEDKCGFTAIGPICGNYSLVMPVVAAEWLIDFYNSNYLDWRGLIEKGLALEAPEGLYNINKKEK